MRDAGLMVQGLGPWQDTPGQWSPEQDKAKVASLCCILTLSVTVAIIRAFGTRRAVLVFLMRVTEKAGIEI